MTLTTKEANQTCTPGESMSARAYSGGKSIITTKEPKSIFDISRYLGPSIAHHPEQDHGKLRSQKCNTEPSFGGELMTAGGLAAANTSGFAVYQGTSVALHGAASAAGMTLPFAAYMSASKALSIAIGPVGWGLLCASVIWKVFR